MDSAPRELPQFVHDFARHMRNYTRNPFGAEAFNGGTTAERHRHEFGHAMERGCCVRPENVCAGCRCVLSRVAKKRGERYCSRACREAHTP